MSDRMPYDEFIERRIVMGLVVSTAYIQKVRLHWDDKRLESPELRQIAKWCMDHFDLYTKAPDRNIEAIFMEKLKHGKISKNDADEIQAILQRISKDFETGDTFNAEYLYDQTKEYFRDRELRILAEQIDSLTEQGLRKEAEKLWKDFRPLEFQDDLQPRSIRATDIEVQPVEWLHKNRIPANKVVVFFGEIGIGKSNCTVDYAARITRGDEAPAGEGQLPCGHVLVATAEDDPDDTWVPRFLAAGGFRKRLHFMDDSILWTFADLSPLEHELKAHAGKIRLLIIDTPNDYIPPEINSNNTSHVRSRILHPLKRLAKQYRVTILLVMHPIKGEGGRASEKVSGSYAWIAAPRSVYIFVRDHTDPHRRLMVPVRVSNAPEMEALAYRIEPDEDGQPVLNWQKRTIRITADEAIRTIKQPETDAQIRNAWLNRLLVEADSTGMLLSEIKKQGKELKYEEHNLYRSFVAIKAEKGLTKTFPTQSIWYAQGMKPKDVSDLANKVGKNARRSR